MTGLKRGSAVALVVLALAAGCSDDTGGQSEASSEPAPPEASSGPAAPEGVECVNLPACAVEVSQMEGLADDDVISIRIEGWDPERSVGIAQCEDPDTTDNPDLQLQPDGYPPAEACNVEGLSSAAQATTADADGVVAFDYEVRAGETMVEESAEGECDGEHDCRLYVFWNFDLRFRSDAQQVIIPLTFA